MSRSHELECEKVLQQLEDENPRLVSFWSKVLSARIERWQRISALKSDLGFSWNESWLSALIHSESCGGLIRATGRWQDLKKSADDLETTISHAHLTEEEKYLRMLNIGYYYHGPPTQFGEGRDAEEEYQSRLHIWRQWRQDQDDRMEYLKLTA